jgi:Rps23 Pro-64 3,4-dihydroxylase Tpa1-like proline 4-hydroxylase
MFIPIEKEELPLIIVDNFLPSKYLDEMFSQIVSLKTHFSKSNWTSGLQEGHGPNCTGSDIWLPFSEEEDDKNNLVGQELADLWKFLFHEGLTDFLDNSNHIEFRKYSRKKHNFVYHIINYGDGGYYNWHLDSKVNGRTWWGINVNDPTLYTFALTLIKDETLIEGGKQLFMKDGKIVELESKNNQLVIFPSSVFHSLTEIKCDKDLEWEKRRFNIQAWLCELPQ